MTSRPTPASRRTQIGDDDARTWTRQSRSGPGATRSQPAAPPPRLARPGLAAVIAAWAGTQTFAAASAAAEAAGIGWARYNTPTDVLDHAQLVERDRWVDTASENGAFLSLRPAADSPDWTWVPGGVPALGQ